MSNALLQGQLFGPLFQDKTIAEHFGDAVMLRHMLAFERAWTEGLMGLGAVSAKEGQAALARMAGFEPDWAALHEGSTRDGLPVPELVKQLRAGLSAGEAIHSGATSQDVIDTAMVLASLEVLAELEARKARVAVALDALQGRFGARKIMGRTRMQAALPITVADRLRLWRAPLEGLEDFAPRLSRLQIGGPVGLRADDGMAAHLAEALGLRAGPCWHTDRSAFVDFGNWLMKLTGHLGKMGQDIALMAQQGVDEVRLSGSGGSSAMPHKQNPVRAEALITLARYVAGQQGILGQALVHEQERSGATWALEWMVLPAMCEAAGAALAHAEALLAQVEDMGA